MGKKKPPAKPKGNGRHASDKKPTGCYVLSLSVENVRCFGPKQTLDCSDGEGRPRQWTVILGDNGTGKTTLLKTAVLSRFGGYAFTKGLLVLRNGAATGMSSVDLALGELHLPPQDHQVLTMSGQRGPKRGKHESEAWRTQEDYGEVTFKGRWTIFAYDVARGDAASYIRPVSDPFNRHHGDFLEAQVRLRDAEEWILNLDHASRLENQHPTLARWEQVKTLLVGTRPGHGVLPEVTAVNCNTTSGPFPQPFVEFHTPYGWVPLRQLGHGYQTMIAWVVDFVSRMVERYPESDNPLAEPAVCLVDEIDLHLHPVWQRKVIGYLSERFPNTQFIVTAHSPLVVQAAASADANIAVLVRSEEKDVEGNHYVEIRNNPEDVRNWRLDQILTSDLFGVDLRSAETEKLFARKRELLAKQRRTKAEEADLARVQAEIDALPVGDTEKFARELDLLRRAADELKSSRKP